MTSFPKNEVCNSLSYDCVFDYINSTQYSHNFGAPILRFPTGSF